MPLTSNYSFFVIQSYIEAVHTETYTDLLTAIVKDVTEQDRLFDAVTKFPSIQIVRASR